MEKAADKYLRKEIIKWDKDVVAKNSKAQQVQAWFLSKLEIYKKHVILIIKILK